MRQVAVCLATFVAVILATASPARAQSASTFVSGSGLDTNPCTLRAPCRSFQRAHDMTAAGGQVTMLDPAGYGHVTISKAIAIVNDGGGEAGINDPVSLTDAISITAGASDVVTLRGLTLNGVGVGRNGITFISGATLNIQNCVIRGFANEGVVFDPHASAAIKMINTIVSNNGSTGVNITEGSATGTITASLEQVTAIGNGLGGVILAPGTVGALIKGTIVDSVAVKNVGTGFALASGGAAATIALINSKAIANGNGVSANVGTVVMSRVTIAGNTNDGFISTSLESFGDNNIIDTTNVGTLTPIVAQ